MKRRPPPRVTAMVAGLAALAGVAVACAGGDDAGSPPATEATATTEPAGTTAPTDPATPTTTTHADRPNTDEPDVEEPPTTTHGAPVNGAPAGGLPRTPPLDVTATVAGLVPPAAVSVEDVARQLAEAFAGSEGPMPTWEQTSDAPPRLLFRARDLPDDSIAGWDLEVVLAAEGPGWEVASATRQVLCRRGLTDEGRCI